MIEELSPSHLSGAKTTKKRKFMLSTDKDDDMDSQGENVPDFLRRKTLVAKMEDKEKE